MSTTTNETTPDLPVFPVVTVSVDEDAHQIHASTQGTDVFIEEYDPALWEEDVTYRNKKTADAAQQVTEAIGHHDPVRVRVFMDEENSYQMWMPPGGGQLNLIESPEPLTVREPGKLWGISRKMLLSILAFVLMFAVMVTLYFVKQNRDEPVAIYTPPPVQLPVSAPVGWDTYADYSLEATTAAPVVVGDQLLYAKGSDLKIASITDGVEKSSTSAGFDITSISVVHGVGENLVAVGGSNAQAAIGQMGSQLHSIERPTQQAQLHWVSGVPVYTSSGAVWVPDDQGKLIKRTAPADTVPAAVFGQSVWMVSTVEPKAWLMDSDSPDLPAVVSLPVPEGKTYKGFIGAVNEHLVFGFTHKDKNMDQSIVIADATKNGAIEKARAVAGQWNENNVAVDVQRNLMLTGSTLIDVAGNHAMKTGANASYGGGFAWTKGTKPARISVDGDVKEWVTSSSQPVIPADVDETGRAVVLYKPNEAEAVSKLYVLRKES